MRSRGFVRLARWALLPALLVAVLALANSVVSADVTPVGDDEAALVRGGETVTCDYYKDYAYVCGWYNCGDNTKCPTQLILTDGGTVKKKGNAGTVYCEVCVEGNVEECDASGGACVFEVAGPCIDTITPGGTDG